LSALEQVGNAANAALESVEAPNWRREIWLASDIDCSLASIDCGSGLGICPFHRLVGATEGFSTSTRKNI
jgi:hypothetical protein